MTCNFFIKAGKNASATNSRQLYVRVIAGAAFDMYATTPYSVPQKYWDQKKGEARIPSVISRETAEALTRLNGGLIKLRTFITERFVRDAAVGVLSKKWLSDTVKAYQDENSIDVGQADSGSAGEFTEASEKYLRTAKVSEIYRKHARTALDSVRRYCLWVSEERKVPGFTLTPRMFDAKVLEDLSSYLTDEGTILEEYPDIMQRIPLRSPEKMRSQNTVTDMLKHLSTFLRWCSANGYRSGNAFEGFRIPQAIYGDPFYLSPDEVTRLAQANITPSWVAVQRDIFIFQCNIGCRVSDLMDFKKYDAVNGRLSYIPRKTLRSKAETVTVPLNATALAIIEKYADCPGDSLLPFISPQKYNDAIKSSLLEAGITRPVVVLDPKTRRPVKKRICDVGSSDMARRTFIGNLYKRVKDPNLIASLTGHVENSQAFCRYRSIDDDIKRELVDMLG